jgi:hypothetical protein
MITHKVKTNINSVIFPEFFDRLSLNQEREPRNTEYETRNTELRTQCQNPETLKL